MKILLTGASGFLGSRSIEALLADGHQLRAIGRSRPKTAVAGFWPWDATLDEVPAEAMDGCDAVVHLAGEPVAQRWTPEVKERIRTSRVHGSEALVRAIRAARARPRTLVSASAIGYYGERGDDVLTEAAPAGKGFLPEISVAWERAVDRATEYGVRVVKLRIGIILGPEGGALQKMLPPFRMGLGGVIGNGAQWMSWIHVDDVVGIIRFCLEREDVRGAVNVTAPRPVRNKEFTRALGIALRRPTLFPVPPLALRLLYGEMATMVLGSQRVEPAALLRAGYRFQYEEIQQALNQLLR